MEPIDLVVLWTMGYLLTFLVFAFFRRQLLDNASTNADAPSASSQSVQTNQDGAEEVVEKRVAGQCPSCGTANDAFFSYCSNCQTPLDEHSPGILSLS